MLIYAFLLKPQETVSMYDSKMNEAELAVRSAHPLSLVYTGNRRAAQESGDRPALKPTLIHSLSFSLSPTHTNTHTHTHTHTSNLQTSTPAYTHSINTF